MSEAHLNNQSNDKHPWRGETVYFATKHEKEKILAPLFIDLELSCMAIEVDTDLLGTFSGEVERTGSVRETLRKKIDAAAKIHPEGNLFLASEGSFGPHPLIGFLPTDLESLLLWNRKLNIEIYAEYLCKNPVSDKKLFGPTDDFMSFLKQIQFPQHGVIVCPDGLFQPIFKGLHHEHDVAQAMIDCFQASTNQQVVISTDLRAHHSPTRRQAILEAGKVLMEKLISFCPDCKCPGFAISRGLPGLPCSECGAATGVAKEVLWECVQCTFSKATLRPDGLKFLSPDQCEFCNP